MLGEDPRFEDHLNCQAIHAKVVARYDPSYPMQLAALRSVCRKCNVVGEGRDHALVRKCEGLVSAAR